MLQGWATLQKGIAKDASSVGCLTEVVVVHHDAHGLPHHAEDAPEEGITDEGVVEASVDVFSQHDQRHLCDLRHQLEMGMVM